MFVVFTITAYMLCVLKLIYKHCNLWTGYQKEHVRIYVQYNDIAQIDHKHHAVCDEVAP